MNQDHYYDHFNSAFKIDTGKTIEVYHKSKLVPGIEMQFSTAREDLLPQFFQTLVEQNGAMEFRKNVSVFENNTLLSKVAPIICYESVFGEYVTEYVKNGANALIYNYK